jgi:hypothetical protein
MRKFDHPDGSTYANPARALSYRGPLFESDLSNEDSHRVPLVVAAVLARPAAPLSLKQLRLFAAIKELSMIQRKASCRCGQLEIETSTNPLRVSVCHCLACQRRTGGAFGVQARFAREAVLIVGRSTRYVRVADSGRRVIYHFCPDCGGTVYYHLEESPDVVAVPVGAFADPQFPVPGFSFYELRRHSWVQISGNLEHFE